MSALTQDGVELRAMGSYLGFCSGCSINDHAAVTDRLCHRLRSDGYAVLDDLPGAAAMCLLPSEALALADMDWGFA